MSKLGLVNVQEPFAGLFTQGMVCHETYKDADGNWVAAEDIEKRDGKAFERDTGKQITIGASEKMSKSKKNVIAPEAIIADYGADTIRWFMLSDTPPGARYRMDRHRRRRLLAFRSSASIASARRRKVLSMSR